MRGDESNLEPVEIEIGIRNDEFAEILSGATDGMQAFMSGQLQATGDLMLATRLQELFPIA